MRNDTARKNEQGSRKSFQLDFFTDLLPEIDTQSNATRAVDFENISFGGEGKSESGLSNTENRNGRPESQCTTSFGRESRDESGGNGSSSDVWITDTINTRSQGWLPGRQDSQREIIYRYIGRDSAVNVGSGMGYAELHGLSTNTLRRSVSESQGEGGLLESERPSADNWANVEWIYCRDNKYRPILTGLNPVIRTIKSSVTPLANGLPEGMVCGGGDSESIDANETQEARVMRLRGYGNAICIQVATEFIKAFMAVNE